MTKFGHWQDSCADSHATALASRCVCLPLAASRPRSVPAAYAQRRPMRPSFALTPSLFLLSASCLPPLAVPLALSLAPLPFALGLACTLATVRALRPAFLVPSPIVNTSLQATYTAIYPGSRTHRASQSATSPPPSSHAAPSSFLPRATLRCCLPPLASRPCEHPRSP